MTPALFEVLRCNWCSKSRPRFRAHRLASGQVICDHCLDWHYHALEFLGGNGAPRGCQPCGVTFDQLRERAPAAEVRMYVVPKDNILQLLCAECVKPYLPKQKQLYKGTQFGSQKLKLL